MATVLPDREVMRDGTARRAAHGRGSSTLVGADLAGEIVAAYQAGLSVREIAEIYRVDHAVVTDLVVTTGARRPPRSKLLRLVTPSGRAARRVARSR